MNEKDLAAAIARKVQDPTQWIMTLRMLIEQAGGDVTRHLPISGDSTNLVTLCWGVLSNLAKRSGVSEKFQQVITDWAAS